MRLEIKMTLGKIVWRAKHDNGQIYFVVNVALRDDPSADIAAASSNYIRYKAEVQTGIAEALGRNVNVKKDLLESNHVKIHMYFEQIHRYATHTSIT